MHTTLTTDGDDDDDADNADGDDDDGDDGAGRSCSRWGTARTCQSCVESWRSARVTWWSVNAVLHVVSYVRSVTLTQTSSIRLMSPTPSLYVPSSYWSAQSSLTKGCIAAAHAQYYFTMGCPSPSKLPLPKGGSGPHLIHGSLGPPKSTTQKVSRLVQPFLQSSQPWETDRQTDHITVSVTVGCICVRSTAMRPNNRSVKCNHKCFFWITLANCKSV